MEKERMHNDFEKKLKEAKDLNRTHPNLINQIMEPSKNVYRLEKILRKENFEKFKFKSFHERQTSIYHSNLKKLEDRLNEKIYENIALKGEISDFQRRSVK
jgi:hypothetical protein